MRERRLGGKGEQGRREARGGREERKKREGVERGKEMRERK